MVPAVIWEYRPTIMAVVVIGNRGPSAQLPQMTYSPN